ncbi:hypothetical protein [Gallaecimonas sp. GXIMD4217]|uniref:Vgb family protein n=1 Tax=Gallaecimonas sp. GXIMD4217 TaxID=3131927 RepID=UPI00311B1230
MRLVLMLLSLLPFSLLAKPAPLPDLLELKAWSVPWGGRPRDPAVAPDGSLWFCGQAGNYIGRLEPGSGDLKRFPLPKGTHPHNLIVAPDGAVWYAGNRSASIGRLDPKSGAIDSHPMPRGLVDPHTLIWDGAGHIWFSAQWSNALGHLNTASGQVQVFKVPLPRARPYGIKLGKDGNPWAVLLGSNHLATVRDGRLSLVEIPRKEARPRRLEITQDGALWYVDYAGGVLGRHDPGDGSFREWPMPGGRGSHPYGTALDDSGRVWIAETGVTPNRLVAFDTKTLRFVSRSKVPGGGSVRHMFFDPRGKAFWFGVDTGYVVRARPR